MLVMNVDLGIDDLDPKLWIRANLVPTLKFAPMFMKFGTHNKSNMLVMNITGSELLQVVKFDPQSEHDQ